MDTHAHKHARTHTNTHVHTTHMHTTHTHTHTQHTHTHTHARTHTHTHTHTMQIRLNLDLQPGSPFQTAWWGLLPTSTTGTQSTCSGATPRGGQTSSPLYSVEPCSVIGIEDGWGLGWGDTCYDMHIMILLLTIMIFFRYCKRLSHSCTIVTSLPLACRECLGTRLGHQ